MTHNSQSTAQKVLGWFTLFCFLSSNTGVAAPGLGVSISAPAERPAFFQVEIPSELASVEDVYEAPAQENPKLILHVQNIHGNYESQVQISKLLQYLYQNYGFKLIFAEGAADKLNPDLMRFFPDAEHNKKLADLMAKNGELTGIEYFLIDGPKDVEAVGIENAELYRKNYEAFKKVYAAKPQADQFIGLLEDRLETLATHILSPEMRRLLGEWKKFESGQRDFLPYIKKLTADAKTVLNLDLESLFAQVEWPQITRLLALQSMEKDLNRKAAAEDRTRLVEFLKSQNISAELIKSIETLDERKITMSRSEAASRKENLPRYLFEHLMEEAGPKGFKFHDYPAFSLWAGYLILQNELDSKNLFEEIEKVFSKILNESAVTEREKNLLELYRDAALLRKLMHLEVSRKEWETAVYRKDWIKPESLTARIQKLSQERENGNAGEGELKNFALSPLQSPVLSEIYSSALDFYDFARQREAVFYETIDKTMAEKKADKAVLVTGGFHTEGLMDLFREHQINVSILTPKVSGNLDNSGYVSTMLENKPTLFGVGTLEQIADMLDWKTQKEQGRSADFFGRITGEIMEVKSAPSNNQTAIAEIQNVLKQFGASDEFTVEPGKSEGHVIIRPVRAEVRANQRKIGSKGFESLEPRRLLTGSDSHLSLDVDGDGLVAPNDALAVISYLNNPIGVPESRLDIDGDGFVAPKDALAIINFLNESQGTEIRIEPFTEVTRNEINIPNPTQLNVISSPNPSGLIQSEGEQIVIKFGESNFTESSTGILSFGQPLDLSQKSQWVMGLQGDIHSYEFGKLKPLLLGAKDGSGKTVQIPISGIGLQEKIFVIPTHAFEGIDLKDVRSLSFSASGYNLTGSYLKIRPAQPIHLESQAVDAIMTELPRSEVRSDSHSFEELHDALKHLLDLMAKNVESGEIRIEYRNNYIATATVEQKEIRNLDHKVQQVLRVLDKQNDARTASYEISMDINLSKIVISRAEVRGTGKTFDITDVQSQLQNLEQSLSETAIEGAISRKIQEEIEKLKGILSSSANLPIINKMVESHLYFISQALLEAWNKDRNHVHAYTLSQLVSMLNEHTDLQTFYKFAEEVSILSRTVQKPLSNKSKGKAGIRAEARVTDYDSRYNGLIQDLAEFDFEMPEKKMEVDIFARAQKLKADIEAEEEVTELYQEQIKVLDSILDRYSVRSEVRNAPVYVPDSMDSTLWPSFFKVLVETTAKGEFIVQLGTTDPWSDLSLRKITFEVSSPSSSISYGTITMTRNAKGIVDMFAGVDGLKLKETAKKNLEAWFREIEDSNIIFNGQHPIFQRARGEVRKLETLINPFLLTAAQRKAYDLLIELGQGHLFDRWSPAGQDEEAKIGFFNQVLHFNRTNPHGSLKAYQAAGIALLQNAKTADDPLKRATFEQAPTANVTAFDPEYQALEEEGLPYANRVGFILPAGGVGDRLKKDWKSGLPKVEIPLSLITEQVHLEKDIRTIDALVRKSNRLTKESRVGQLFIMTSDETHEGTQALLSKLGFIKTTKNYGVNSREVYVSSQYAIEIRIAKQELVPAFVDNDGHFTTEESNPYEIVGKPHGHGDVHSLMYSTGTAEDWKAMGYQQVVFFQDTNAPVINAFLPGLAISIKRNLDINFLTTVRELGEAMGMIMKVTMPDAGGVVVRNVEYSYVKQGVFQDTANDQGKSAYPGNMNVIIAKLDSYAAMLQVNKGVMPELINPKYADDAKTKFKAPTRPETNMQDMSWSRGAETFNVGATNVSDKRLWFAPTKNDYASGQEEIKGERNPDTMAYTESSWYRDFRLVSSHAGVKVQVEPTEPGKLGLYVDEDPSHTNAFKDNLPAVEWDRNFGATAQEVKGKFDNVEIKNGSALSIFGENVRFENVVLRGGLVVRVPQGSSLTVTGNIQNNGLQFVKLTEEELANKDLPDAIRSRRYKLINQDQAAIVDLTYLPLGNYIYDETGLYETVQVMPQGWKAALERRAEVRNLTDVELVAKIFSPKKPEERGIAGAEFLARLDQKKNSDKESFRQAIKKGLAKINLDEHGRDLLAALNWIVDNYRARHQGVAEIIGSNERSRSLERIKRLLLLEILRDVSINGVPILENGKLTVQGAASRFNESGLEKGAYISDLMGPANVPDENKTKNWIAIARIIDLEARELAPKDVYYGEPYYKAVWSSGYDQFIVTALPRAEARITDRILSDNRVRERFVQELTKLIKDARKIIKADDDPREFNNPFLGFIDAVEKNKKGSELETALQDITLPLRGFPQTAQFVEDHAAEFPFLRGFIKEMSRSEVRANEKASVLLTGWNRAHQEFIAQWGDRPYKSGNVTTNPFYSIQATIHQPEGYEVILTTTGLTGSTHSRFKGFINENEFQSLVKELERLGDGILEASKAMFSKDKKVNQAWEAFDKKFTASISFNRLMELDENGILISTIRPSQIKIDDFKPRNIFEIPALKEIVRRDIQPLGRIYQVPHSNSFGVLNGTLSETAYTSRDQALLNASEKIGFKIVRVSSGISDTPSYVTLPQRLEVAKAALFVDLAVGVDDKLVVFIQGPKKSVFYQLPRGTKLNIGRNPKPEFAGNDIYVQASEVLNDASGVSDLHLTIGFLPEGVEIISRKRDGSLPRNGTQFIPFYSENRSEIRAEGPVHVEQDKVVVKVGSLNLYVTANDIFVGGGVPLNPGTLTRALSSGNRSEVRPLLEALRDPKIPENLRPQVDVLASMIAKTPASQPLPHKTKKAAADHLSFAIPVGTDLFKAALANPALVELGAPYMVTGLAAGAAELGVTEAQVGVFAGAFTDHREVVTKSNLQTALKDTLLAPSANKGAVVAVLNIGMEPRIVAPALESVALMLQASYTNARVTAVVVDPSLKRGERLSPEDMSKRLGLIRSNLSKEVQDRLKLRVVEKEDVGRAVQEAQNGLKKSLGVSSILDFAEGNFSLLLIGKDSAWIEDQASLSIAGKKNTLGMVIEDQHQLVELAKGAFWEALTKALGLTEKEYQVLQAKFNYQLFDNKAVLSSLTIALNQALAQLQTAISA